MKTRRVLSQVKKRILNSNQPAISGLDQKLQSYLDFDGGFFIEAGANDGYTQSNTYYLEKKRGWHGILVEGIPELVETCHSGRPNSEIYDVALVANDFEDTTITMHYAGLMSTVENSFGSVEETFDHIERGVKVQHLEGSYSVEVPTSTLDAVLESYTNLGPIDFLSLDVEGYEMSVLLGLNLRKFRPKYILVEARDSKVVHAHLVSQGYRFIEKMSHHDYFYGSE